MLCFSNTRGLFFQKWEFLFEHSSFFGKMGVFFENAEFVFFEKKESSKMGKCFCFKIRVF